MTLRVRSLPQKIPFLAADLRCALSAMGFGEGQRPIIAGMTVRAAQGALSGGADAKRGQGR